MLVISFLLIGVGCYVEVGGESFLFFRVGLDIGIELRCVTGIIVLGVVRVITFLKWDREGFYVFRE